MVQGNIKNGKSFFRMENQALGLALIGHAFQNQAIGECLMGRVPTFAKPTKGICFGSYCNQFFCV